MLLLQQVVLLLLKLLALRTDAATSKFVGEELVKSDRPELTAA